MGSPASNGARRTRRLRRSWKPWVALALIAILVVFDRMGWLLVPRLDDFERYHNQFVLVTRVIDGDTIEIALPDPLAGAVTTHIRLWGIDCPEVGYAGTPSEPWAAEARSFAQKLIAGASVRLIVEPGRIRDSFSRILAHVELVDGRSLNRELLAAGLAMADDRWPHARLLTYEQAEFMARSRRIGIWSD